ncbi:hypothetical protein [Spiroplasma endosymbiont of Phycita roborella]|uniref:hypothetical protein n=1 Tax=Spiroplasma endosymbiont of Phycita roborella TaxID=3066311 RepID=UPI00313E8B8F
MEKNKKVLIKKIEKIFKIIQINQKNLSKERIRKHNQKPKVGTKKLKYSQRPEVKARKREYAQRPEVKARKRESYQRWSQKNKEKIREYNHRWCQKNKEKIREYYQRPEVKARKREYNQKSEVKARKREYYYRWYQKNKEKMREHTQSPIEWYDTQICKNSKYIKTKYATVIVKQKVDDTIMLSNIVPMPVTKSNEEQEIVHKADIFNVKDLSNGINNIETNMFERPEIPKTPEIIDIILDMSENKIFSNVNGKVISNSI